MAIFYLTEAPAARLSTEAEKELGRISSLKNYDRGELILRPGSEWCRIYIIKEGVVKLYRSENGRRVSILTLGRGDVFGDFSFISGVPVPPNYFAEGTKRGVLAVVATTQFRELVKCHPEIALRLISELSRNLSEAQSKIHDLALSSAGDRVLRELSRLADDAGLTPPLTHEQIAEATGLTRESVTRAITKLKKDHCFKVLSGHRYRLC